MRRRRDILVCLVLVLLYGAPVGAAELDKLQAIYDGQMEKIEKSHAERVAGWRVEYFRVLKALQGEYQRAGDLDGWASVDREIKRFATSSTLSSDAVVQAPMALREVQERFVSLSAALPVERSKQVLSLTEEYVTRLTALQREWTKQSKFTEALATRDVIKAVRESRTVTAAEFVVGVNEAELLSVETEPEAEPDLEPEPEAEKVTDSMTPQEQEPQEEGEAVGSGEGVKVYADGERPPRDSRLVYKRKILSNSDHSPLARKVTVSVSVVEKEQSDGYRDSSHYGYSTSVSRRGSVGQLVRLEVRVANTSYELSDGTAVVEYFAKPVAKSAGRIIPTRIMAKHVRLPKVASDPVYVDLPPVSLYQSSYKYRSSYGSIYSSESGNEFYGLIVTVFDGDDQLIYQGVSVAGLKDSALAEKPEDNGSLKADYEAKELRYYALRDALNRDYDNEELSRAYSEARDAYYRARTAYEAVKHNYE